MGGSLIRARSSGIAVAIIYTESAPDRGINFLPEIRREFYANASTSAQEQQSIIGVIREIDPATIFLPSCFEQDPGIRLMSGIVEEMLAEVPYQKATWSYDISRIGESNRYLDISNFTDRKHEELDLIEGHRSDLLPPILLVEQFRAGNVSGASAAEGFWSVDNFEPLKTANTTLLSLLRRSQEPPSAAKPSVTVVIRTKDRPSLLKEALSSLTLQAHQALHVIVVNDGGEPVGKDIDIFRSSLNIHLLELEKSRGRSAAANAGIAAAKGQWLLMLDDDDVYLPNGIQSLVSIAHDPDCVYYGKVESVSYSAAKKTHLRYFGAPYDKDLMAFENQIPFIGCLMPLAHVKAIGGVDETFDCFEDWDLYLRLAERCSFKFLDRVVAEYRSFGETFISGKGGLPQQERGLSQLFAKHLHCAKAGLLARAQIAVKRDLIPREVQREAAHAVRLAHESEIAIREQMLEEMNQARVARELEFSRLEGMSPLLRNVFVSIIIVNYNGRHHLEKCLPSVFATRNVNFEVVVVDNGSKDDSVAWVSKHWPQVRLISEQQNHGFGRANLIGVHAAKAGYVALLNSDTVVTPEWLTELLAPLLSNPEIGSTCSQLRLLFKPELLNARGGGMSRLGFGYDVDFGLPFVAASNDLESEPVDVFFPSGAAMLMRKQEFLDIGAFDPAFFMYHEDVDLGWRFWLSGRRVVMCPRSIVFHAFGGTTEVEMGSSWRDTMGNRHNLRSLWKNYELRHALGATLRLFGGWLSGGHIRFASKVLIWNLIHIRGTWRERRRMQSLRKISDAELFRRGLITGGVAPVPDLSVAGAAANGESLIASPHLWPGRSSALGRLGAGWYFPEKVNDAWVRATAGSARATLQLAPNEKGILQVELHLPEALCGKMQVSLACNESRQTFPLDKNSYWQTLKIPVVADQHGLLKIEIVTPVWNSHEEFQNWDMRKLGCFVRKLTFLGEKKEPAYAPEYVTVLITTFNRWSVLDRTLTALTHQTWKNFEVVVVDDGSRDETWQRLQAWKNENLAKIKLNIFTQENTGQGIARNNGLMHAQGDLILFIGDDTIPEADFLEQHVQRHREAGMPCAVVGYTNWDSTGGMQVTPLLEYVNEGGHQFGYRYMTHGEDVPYTCLYTSNVSIPRDILGEQPFDPKFRTYGWEDIDLGYRLSKRGLRIIYNQQARVHHFHPMNLEDFYSRQIKVGAAIATIYSVHPDLMRDPFMPPPTRPKSWRVLARIFVPPLLPLINWMDSKFIKLPERVYRAVLSTGFWIGRDQAAARKS